ncbi:MAG: hypothetical protein A3E61_02050 [Candidatus Colwellbacteria bacterium RIFCSPHIGHO2_12_FULL_43_12]|uniref:Type II secretion system protein GspG C-terminal domain-containing protein n=2 Tax=Candidatus Colwelliibacteriota TaxID=1817904 RepID=A0A1G1Z3K5_9BACT|nr:MAG: hypothetical protein A3E61_02050 [Candidatus Colwellbacteria bacterium RIFCSPHIGHO2_12_FULL_43_12]OGY60986.1 MAG: hypothetical protein A3F99_00340 [Candidatus Colwellbacteria bacterium RIFCSPLOWO2_12_FULL_43_11]
MKYLPYIVIGAVAVAVVTSFFVIGTPQDERLRRFDETRANDLSSIQNQVVEFWRTKGRLPEVTKELENDITFFTLPRDPETQADYEYRVLGQYQYELCANFVTEKTYTDNSYPYPVMYGYESKWTHGVGRTCFTRTIDPELFPDTKIAPPKGQ